MITIMIGAAVLIGGIALGALFLSKAVNKTEDTSAQDKLAAKQSEWAALAKGYDAAKGYDDRLADSEAYGLCKALLEGARAGVSDLEDSYGTSLAQSVKLPDITAFLSFDAGAWMKANMDADDLRTLVKLSDAVYELGAALEQDADQACVAAYDAGEDMERMKCKDLLEDAFRLLSPMVRIEYSCPPENGKSYKNMKRIGRDDIAAIAGIPIAGRPDQSARRRALAVDGFRCKRCGRSPLSGGTIRPVDDAHEGRPVALCENCAPRIRTYGGT